MRNCVTQRTPKQAPFRIRTGLTVLLLVCLVFLSGAFSGAFGEVPEENRIVTPSQSAEVTLADGDVESWKVSISPENTGLQVSKIDDDTKFVVTISCTAETENGSYLFSFVFKNKDEINERKVSVKATVSDASPKKKILTAEASGNPQYGDSLSGYIVVKADGETLDPDAYSILPDKADKAGPLEVTVAPKDASTYKPASLTVTLTIAKKQISPGFNLTASGITWKQALRESSLTNRDAAEAAVLQYGWEKDDTTFTEPGTFQPNVTVSLREGEAEKYALTGDTVKAIPVTVTKVPVTPIWPAAAGIRYGQQVKDAALSPARDDYGSFRWIENDAGQQPESGDRVFTAEYVPDQPALYEANETRKELTVAVARKEMPEGSISASAAEAVYDGSAHESAPLLTDGEFGGRTLAAGTDYEIVRYENNVHAGEHTASVTVNGKGNYTGTRTVTFTIRPRTAELAWEPLQFEYDGELHAPEASVTNLADGDSCGVTVAGAETEPGGSLQYTAAATGLSNPDYQLPEDPTVLFDILKKKITPVWPAGTFRYTYGETLSARSPGRDETGTFVWENPDHVPGVSETESGLDYLPDDPDHYTIGGVSYRQKAKIRVSPKPFVPEFPTETFRYTYEDRLDKANLPITDQRGRFTWKDGEHVPDVDETTATVLFTLTNPNYAPAVTEGTVNIQVAKKTVKPLFRLSASDITWQQKTGDSVLANLSPAEAEERKYGGYAWTDPESGFEAAGVYQVNVCYLLKDKTRYEAEGDPVKAIPVTVTKVPVTPAIVSYPDQPEENRDATPLLGGSGIRARSRILIQTDPAALIKRGIRVTLSGGGITTAVKEFAPKDLGTDGTLHLAVSERQLLGAPLNSTGRKIWTLTVEYLDPDLRDRSGEASPPEITKSFFCFAANIHPAVPATPMNENMPFIAGIAEPGSSIVLTGGGETVRTVSNDDGRFLARMPQTPEGQTLRIRTADTLGNTAERTYEIQPAAEEFLQKAFVCGPTDFPGTWGADPETAQVVAITGIRQEDLGRGTVTLPLLAGTVLEAGEINLRLEDGTRLVWSCTLPENGTAVSRKLVLLKENSMEQALTLQGTEIGDEGTELPRTETLYLTGYLEVRLPAEAVIQAWERFAQQKEQEGKNLRTAMPVPFPADDGAQPE